MRRRMLAILAALALGASAHASVAYVVQTDALRAVVDANGDTLIAGDDVVDLFAVGELFACGRVGDYALYDASGARLGEQRFGMIWEAEGVLVFRKDGLYGAMSRAGEVIVAPEWTQLVPNGEGAFLALDESPLDEQADEVIRVARGEAPLRTGARTANGLRALSDGRMAYKAADGRYGWLDARGGVALPATWFYGGDFVDGAAIVSDGDGYGLIGADGAERIPCAYAWMARTEGMIVCQSIDGGVDAYTADGTSLKYRLDVKADQVSAVGGCAAVRAGGRTLLYDAAGERMLEASAGATFSPGTGAQLIASDGNWGEACQWLVDPDGSAASDRFQRILPLAPGRYAVMTMRGRKYRSEELGRDQTRWHYDTVRYGMIDASGAWLLPAVYREIRALGADRLLLIDDGELTFSDADGQPIRTWPRVCF